MVTTSEDDFINIKKKYYDMTYYILLISIRVRMTSRKSSVKKKIVSFCIPNSRILIYTINRFLKVTNNDGIFLNEIMRLSHAYFFLQIPMQEAVFNTHQMDFPFM